MASSTVATPSMELLAAAARPRWDLPVGSWNGPKTIAFRNQKSWILSLRTEQEKRPHLDPWNARERTRKPESFVSPRLGKKSPSSPRMAAAPSHASQGIMIDMVDVPCLHSQEIHSGSQQRDAIQVQDDPSGPSAAPPETKRLPCMGETLRFWNTWEASTPRARAGPRWKVLEGEPVLHPAQGSFQSRRSPRKSPKSQDQCSSACRDDTGTVGAEGVEMAAQTSNTRPRIRTWRSLARAEAAAEASLAAQEAAVRGYAAVPASGAAFDSQVLLRSKERLKRMVGLGQISMLRQEMKQSLSSNRGKFDQQSPEKDWKHSNRTLVHAGTHAMSDIKAMAAQRAELQKMRKRLEEMHVERKTPRKNSTLESLSMRFQQTREVQPTSTSAEDA
eukprot:TRINITY_DN75747_c0_g1_i1.p1 TRINITY_DN75747_c0_g1~~TRINITY_DN75747_c0_g1_i1.p1  ORF type:complete len:412 (-),score=54.70 TRINITY_DN75747_c0_g1_i1:164-1330(-)